MRQNVNNNFSMNPPILRRKTIISATNWHKDRPTDRFGLLVYIIVATQIRSGDDFFEKLELSSSHILSCTQRQIAHLYVAYQWIITWSKLIGNKDVKMKAEIILGLQPRDEAAMLGDNATKVFRKICIIIEFSRPAEENSLLLSPSMAAEEEKSKGLTSKTVM